MGYPYDDIELSHERINQLSTPSHRRSAGREGGRRELTGVDALASLAGVFMPPRQARQQETESLAEMADVFGGEFAQQQGISEDEARRQITEGVQEPEAPAMGWLRSLHILGPQEGEPYSMRMAHIRGRLGRGQLERANRGAGEKEAANLGKLSQYLEDPSVLNEPMSRAMSHAGYGDVPAHVQRKAPSSLIEAAATNPEALQKWVEAQREIAAAQRGPSKPTAYEQFRNDMLNPDPKIVEAAKAWRHRTAKGDDPEQAMRDLIKGNYFATQGWASLDAWKAGGFKGPRPLTPTLNVYHGVADRMLRGEARADATMDSHSAGGDDPLGAAIHEMFGPKGPGRLPSAGDVEGQPPPAFNPEDYPLELPQ